MPLEVTDLRGFLEALDLTSRAINRLAATAGQLERMEDGKRRFEDAAAARDGVGMSEANHVLAHLGPCDLFRDRVTAVLLSPPRDLAAVQVASKDK